MCELLRKLFQCSYFNHRLFNMIAKIAKIILIIDILFGSQSRDEIWTNPKFQETQPPITTFLHALKLFKYVKIHDIYELPIIIGDGIIDNAAKVRLQCGSPNKNTKLSLTVSSLQLKRYFVPSVASFCVPCRFRKSSISNLIVSTFRCTNNVLLLLQQFAIGNCFIFRCRNNQENNHSLTCTSIKKLGLKLISVL